MQIRKGKNFTLIKIQISHSQMKSKGFERKQQHNRNNVDQEKQHEDENEINNEARKQ